MVKDDATVVRATTIPTAWARDALARLGVAGTEATGEPSDVTLRRRGGRWTLETRWPAVVAEPVAPDGALREQLKAKRAREREKTRRAS